MRKKISVQIPSLPYATIYLPYRAKQR